MTFDVFSPDELSAWLSNKTLDLCGVMASRHALRLLPLGLLPVPPHYKSQIPLNLALFRTLIMIRAIRINGSFDYYWRHQKSILDSHFSQPHPDRYPLKSTGSLEIRLRRGYDALVRALKDFESSENRFQEIRQNDISESSYSSDIINEDQRRFNVLLAIKRAVGVYDPENTQFIIGPFPPSSPFPVVREPSNIFPHASAFGSHAPGEALFAEIADDIKWLEAGNGDWKQLEQRPLWTFPCPEEIRLAWDAFRLHFQGAGQWDQLISWYDRRIQGSLTEWGVAGEADAVIATRLIVIDKGMWHNEEVDEDFWRRGRAQPEVVDAKISEWLSQWTIPEAETADKAEPDFDVIIAAAEATQTLRVGTLEDEQGRSEIFRRLAELEAVVAELRPARDGIGGNAPPPEARLSQDDFIAASDIVAVLDSQASSISKELNKSVPDVVEVAKGAKWLQNLSKWITGRNNLAPAEIAKEFANSFGAKLREQLISVSAEKVIGGLVFYIARLLKYLIGF